MLADTHAPCTRFSAQVTSTAAPFVDPQLFPFQLHSRGGAHRVKGKERETGGEGEGESESESERASQPARERGTETGTERLSDRERSSKAE